MCCVVVIIGAVVILADTAHSAALTFPHFVKDVRDFNNNSSSIPVPAHPEAGDISSSSLQQDVAAPSTQSTIDVSSPMMPTPEKLRQKWPPLHPVSQRQEYINQHSSQSWNSYKRQTPNSRLFFPDDLLHVQRSRHPVSINYLRNNVLNAQRNVHSQLNSQTHHLSPLSQNLRDFRRVNVMNASPSSLHPQSLQNNLRLQQRNPPPLPTRSPAYRNTIGDNPWQRTYPTPQDSALKPQNNNRFGKDIIRLSSEHFIHDLTSYYYKKYKFIPSSSVIRTIPSTYNYGGLETAISGNQQSPSSSNIRRSQSVLGNEALRPSYEFTDLNERVTGRQHQPTSDGFLTYDPEQYPPSVSFGEPYYDDEVPPHVYRSDFREDPSRNIRTGIYKQPPYHRNVTPTRYNGRSYATDQLPSGRLGPHQNMRALNYAQLLSGYTPAMGRTMVGETISAEVQTSTHENKEGHTQKRKHKHFVQFNGHGGPIMTRFKK